jgi:hypothetical protein
MSRKQNDPEHIKECNERWIKRPPRKPGWRRSFNPGYMSPQAKKKYQAKMNGETIQNP